MDSSKAGRLDVVVAWDMEGKRRRTASWEVRSGLVFKYVETSSESLEQTGSEVVQDQVTFACKQEVGQCYLELDVTSSRCER
jgi:hypothetical protein